MPHTAPFPPTHFSHLLQRIRAEFLEMPGLRLTREQARRLFALQERTCEDLLDVLVDTGFLKRTPDGLYGRDN
jgi:hypothetical protein